ncbi:MAG: glycosyltransferase WbuB [Calditrichaeota bacterium]|nr:MAG: glycosyltransferase WbuB [Calditrichota bacterium]
MKAFAGKVLIIVQNLPVPFDRRVWLEAKTLRDHGLHVSVISPKSREHFKSHEVIEGISVYRYAMPIQAEGVLSYLFEFAYSWMMTALLSLKVLLRDGFDVIQACNPPDTYWLLGMLYKLGGKTFIFDHHDLSPEMFDSKYAGGKDAGGKDAGGKRLLRTILVWLEKMTFKTAKIVMSTNDSYKEIAVNRGHKNPQDVYVVRTGPDLNRLKSVPVEPQLKNGKPFMVCYLGEMCPQDGVDLLIESIEYYLHGLQRLDTHFVLVGGGPAMPLMKELAESKGLQDHVQFTGRVSDQDLCRYLSSADVCVDPDPWSEWSNHSTMNKMLEYMTFGKPIIAYDLEEHRNSAGRAAVYVKPNDTRLFAKAVSRLLDDPSERKLMGHFGSARIRGQLSWAHTQKALLAAYHRLFPTMMSADDAEQNILDLVLSRIQTNAVDDLVYHMDSSLYFVNAGDEDQLLLITEKLLQYDDQLTRSPLNSLDE